ncbi:MAG TPA: TIGR02679 family protein [Pseudonocardia sp.]|nr:TIGR02679 family protein [Pseudonocardia sp.]
MTDPARLERLLGGADLSWLVARVRRRMARAEPLDGAVTLTGTTRAQRSAVALLLGRRPQPGKTLTVSLAAVDEVIRRSGACPDGLAAAVTALTGEVTDRAEAAADLDRRWQAAFAPVHDAVDLHPELTEWLRQIRASGLVRRLAGTPESASPLLASLAAVLAQLPAHGEPLGRFAARHAGEAHALDQDRPLTTLALGAARALSNLPEGHGAEWRREVWASVGVLCDDVSSTVLTLGLPGDTHTPTGRALAALHEAGQPCVLTLRQLVREPFHLATQEVFMCENPVVVSAAADQLLDGRAPLICTHGQPGAAVMHLLRALCSTGATVRYHGDFDWGGLRIGNVIFSRIPAVPWRFRTADYRAAVKPSQGRYLTGTPATAHWDPCLTNTMRETGVAVEEEHTVDDLLSDLAR